MVKKYHFCVVKNDELDVYDSYDSSECVSLPVLIVVKDGNYFQPWLMMLDSGSE